MNKITSVFVLLATILVVASCGQPSSAGRIVNGRVTGNGQIRGIYVKCADGILVVTGGEDPGPSGLEFPLPSASTLRALKTSGDGEWVEVEWNKTPNPMSEASLWLKNKGLAKSRGAEYEKNPVCEQPYSETQYFYLADREGVVAHASPDEKTQGIALKKGAEILVLEERAGTNWKKVHVQNGTYWILYDGPPPKARVPAMIGERLFPNNEFPLFLSDEYALSRGLEYSVYAFNGRVFRLSGICAASIRGVSLQLGEAAIAEASFGAEKINSFEFDVDALKIGLKRGKNLLKVAYSENADPLILYLLYPGPSEETITAKDGVFEYSLEERDGVIGASVSLYDKYEFHNQDFPYILPDRRSYIVDLGDSRRVTIKPILKASNGDPYTMPMEIRYSDGNIDHAMSCLARDLVSETGVGFGISVGPGGSFILATGAGFESFPDYRLLSSSTGETYGVYQLARDNGLGKNNCSMYFEDGNVTIKEFMNPFAGGKPPFYKLVLSLADLKVMRKEEVVAE